MRQSVELIKKRAGLFALALVLFSVSGAAPAKHSPVVRDAMSLAREGKYEEAINGLKQVLIQSPNDMEARIALGLMYYKAKQYDNSLNEFGAVMLMDPNNAMAYYFTAMIYEQQAKSSSVSLPSTKVLKQKALDSWRSYLRVAEGSGDPDASRRHIGISKQESIDRAKKHMLVLEGELGNEAR